MSDLHFASHHFVINREFYFKNFFYNGYGGFYKNLIFVGIKAFDTSWELVEQCHLSRLGDREAVLSYCFLCDSHCLIN